MHVDAAQLVETSHHTSAGEARLLTKLRRKFAGHSGITLDLEFAHVDGLARALLLLRSDNTEKDKILPK